MKMKSALREKSTSNVEVTNVSKHGVMGTFHKVSRKYLPLYVAEFEFQYNNRLNYDIFGAAVATC